MMSTNPFESPKDYGPAIGVLSGDRADLRKVAQYQKGILVCILLYLLSFPIGFVLPEPVRFLAILPLFAVGVASTVFIFLLATKVYGTGAGVVLGILTLIPCVGLIVLLIINSKATSTLQLNRVRVGLMGAKMSDLDALG